MTKMLKRPQFSTRDKFASLLLPLDGTFFQHVRVEKKEHRPALLYFSGYQVFPRKEFDFLSNFINFRFKCKIFKFWDLR